MRKHTTPKAIRIVIATGDSGKQTELKKQLESDQSIQVVGNACNGVEALICCGKFTPDLVLMDVMMPESDGITGTKMIKTGFPAIKVLISGVENEEQFQNALQSGADGCLRKRLGAKELIAAIKNVIAGVTVNNEGVYIP